MTVEEILASMNSKQPLLEETPTVDHNNYWISLKYKKSTTVSLFYTDGRKSDVLVKREDGWEEIELDEEEAKKMIDEFVERRKDGGIRYKKVRRVSILHFEEFTRDQMIEYDMKGDIIYKGECEGDIGDGFYRSGHGCEFVDGQLVYDGNWVMNKRQGQGKRYVNGEVFYEGEWDDGFRNGQGKSYVNGEVYYEGEWKNDLHHGNGRGVLDDMIYEGKWRNDKPHGEGKCFRNGELYFDGQWKNGKPNGFGTLFVNDNDIKKGDWKDGYLQIDNKYYNYQTQQYEGMRGMPFIISFAIIGLIFIYGGAFVHQQINPEKNFYSFFLTFGCSCLILACFHHLPYFWCYYVSIVLNIFYGLYLLYNLLPMMLGFNLLYNILMILAVYVMVASFYVLYTKPVNMNYRDITVFDYMVRKKAFACIFIELFIGLLLTSYYYRLFWKYHNIDWWGHRTTDLRNYGNNILIDGLVYICLVIAHCFDGYVFIIANLIGIIWGIVTAIGFGYFYYYFDYYWYMRKLCPTSTPYRYFCTDLKRLCLRITLFTWACTVTSIILYFYNKKENSQPSQNTIANSEV